MHSWMCLTVPWMHRPAALGDTNKSYIFLDAGTACRTHVMTLKQLEILDVPQIKPGRKICLYNSHSEDCFCHFVQLIFEKNANMNHQKSLPAMVSQVFAVFLLNLSFINLTVSSCQAKFWDQQTFGCSTIWLESPKKFAMEMQSYFRDDALTGGFEGRNAKSPAAGNRYL